MYRIAKIFLINIFISVEKTIFNNIPKYIRYCYRNMLKYLCMTLCIYMYIYHIPPINVAQLETFWVGWQGNLMCISEPLVVWFISIVTQRNISFWPQALHILRCLKLNRGKQFIYTNMGG